MCPNVGMCTRLQCPQRPEASGLSGAVSSCELPDVGVGNQTRILSNSLTAEPSLQPLIL